MNRTLQIRKSKISSYFKAEHPLDKWTRFKSSALKHVARSYPFNIRTFMHTK